MTKLILGVDPGITGALAFYDVNSGELTIEDMPTLGLKVGKSIKQRISLYELARIIDFQAKHIACAVVENPSAMPGQGVSSSFGFGFACGAVQAAIAANFITMHLVAPAVWKRDLKLNASKDGSRQRALELFPKHAGLFARAKDDGRAEAALLAYYGQHFLKHLASGS